MTSIISGYEYDIFISYRQKDNKYDGWVTEFVDNLKRELEATFKEEISVYFDINPHDGLLETHDVEKSLEGKLKSLIFIPIVSQTYCDPKSFAWQQEFCAFNTIAKEDPFGRDIKLRGGNVASRILPIKINDLDPEDNELLEKELGGFLRAIEFIYKEPGVNRPLTSDDDPKTNLNKTRYRNQINKVALSIKEIITVIKKPDQAGDVSSKAGKAASINGSVAEIEKSIAVLPFINDSPDQENTYFINGVMEEILNNLQRIKDLRVISRTSVEMYRDQRKPLTEIAEELGVNYIVEGSGQKYGNVFRLRAQLIMAAKETHLWGESFQQKITEVEDIFNIQIKIAESIAEELKAIISPDEKRVIEKIPTKDLGAYEDFLKGRFYLYKLTGNDFEIAIRYFESAILKDPDYAPAYANIAISWAASVQFGYKSPEEAGPSIQESLIKALELDSNNVEVQYTLAIFNTWVLWDWEGGEETFLKALSINPNHAEAHAYYSHFLLFLRRSPDEVKKEIEIALKLDPLNPLILSLCAVSLLIMRRPGESIQLFNDALRIDPNYSLALSNLGEALYLDGRIEEALEKYKAYYSTMNLHDVAEAIEKGVKEGSNENAFVFMAEALERQFQANYWLPAEIAWRFVQAGDKNKALDWLEVGYEKRDQNMPYLCLPLFDPIREEPRFQEIARKMNLPY